MLPEIIIHGRIKHGSIQPVSGTFPDFPNQYGILIAFLNCVSEFSPEPIVNLTGYIQPPAINVILFNPVLSYLTEIICCLIPVQCQLRHHPLISEAFITGIGFRILGTYHRIFQPVKPIPVRRTFSFFHHIIKSLKVPSTMIKDTVNNNTDSLPVTALHQLLKLLVRTKAGINMKIVQKIIFMVFPCGKDRIDINGIDTKLCQIIYVFRDPLYGSSKPSMNRFLSIILLCLLPADITSSGGKAVRENIVDHGILNPLWRCHDIRPVIKGKLIILGPVIHRLFGKSVAIV